MSLIITHRSVNIITREAIDLLDGNKLLKSLAKDKNQSQYRNLCAIKNNSNKSVRFHHTTSDRTVKLEECASPSETNKTQSNKNRVYEIYTTIV